MEGQTQGNPSSSGENAVLDVKPLRSLAPMFPTPFGFNAVTVPGPRPFVCVTPVAPFASGSEPSALPNSNSLDPPNPPNYRPADSVPRPSSNGAPPVFANAAPMEVPLVFANAAPMEVPSVFANAAPMEEPRQSAPVRAPRPTNNGAPRVVELNFSSPAVPASTSPSDTPPKMVTPLNEDNSAVKGSGTSASGRRIKRPGHLSSYTMSGTDPEGSEAKKVTVKRKYRPKKVYDGNSESSLFSSHEDPRQAVEAVLMTFDGLRRRFLQLDEMINVNRRPDLKASSTMMTNGLRANMSRTIGAVPGIEVGDIFYFRIEMCLVGLHAPIMAGIDYMTAKFEDGEDPVAICVVSSGGYENEEEDTDVLIYSGQGGGGGNKSEGKQMDDQKLERGNLALERSLHRGNLIRVVRSAKDLSVLNGKIYIYDGLYKIQTSWVDKAKSGYNVFKYKLLREPRQPDGIAIWKMTQKWIANPSSRGKVILPDISSGVENLPVSLVNEVDGEKGPGHFTYVTELKYSRPINSRKPLHSCVCPSVCLPSDATCSCASINGGNLPYSSSGFLVSRKHLVYECTATCQCSNNCRNRLTQKGIKLHFEVFRTRDRGWGLRCWDPIRAGTFICEYIGEVVDKIEVGDDGEEDDYMFQATRDNEKVLQWNYAPELLGEPSSTNANEVPNNLPIINAKNMGNVSRFMNHSCSPNTFWQPVEHDHDGFPHIVFFAINHIPPMTELTYDYGLSGGDSAGGAGSHSAKKCLCGSSKCRGYFR